MPRTGSIFRCHDSPAAGSPPDEASARACSAGGMALPLRVGQELILVQLDWKITQAIVVGVAVLRKTFANLRNCGPIIAVAALESGCIAAPAGLTPRV